MSVSTDQVQTRWAAPDQGDAASLILGDSYHPGGRALTRRLACLLHLESGERVLDLASRTSMTACFLAAEFGVAVDGVRFANDTTARANAKATQLGVSDRVRFHLGTPEHLPFADASVDAVVSNCAFSTVPDLQLVASEMARVLRPGGRVGITDVTVDPAHQNPGLDSLAGSICCIAGVWSVTDHKQLLEAAGFQVVLTERHDHALSTMIKMIDARLTVLAVTKAPLPDLVDLDKVRDKLNLAARAVSDQIAAFSLFVAQKPA